MEFEFEGRTEKEAIDRAAGELGLEKDDFDVEILETQKNGLFKKGFVRIKVHVGDFAVGSSKGIPDPMSNTNTAAPAKQRNNTRYKSDNRMPLSGISRKELPPQGEFEEKVAGFTAGLIERMGYPGKISVLFRDNNKLGLKIDSEHSSILIGKKGKNLDAIQMLLNVYAGRLGKDNIRIVLDTENYRIRREESLVRLAYNVAEKVRETRDSILLEPMNPFDRWFVHTTLNDINDIETKSEGDGLYKQIRVFYKGLR
ncbi:MAG: protein jag [Treponema sp.]|jgi:spoIIIJ-associated protein|nr:protein jag [Treponema sp.]